MDGGFRATSGFDRLVMYENVQKELKLDEDQLLKSKEVVHEIRQKHKVELDKVVKDSGLEEERTPKVAGLLRQISKETLARLKPVLRPEQLARLKQIEFQERGLRAFHDPDTEKAFHLTTEQKARIATIQEQCETTMRQVIRNQGNHQGRGTPVQKLLAIRKEMVEKAIETLTPEQKKIWSTLAGPPFEFKIEPRANRQSS
jgi:hypothetical protein